MEHKKNIIVAVTGASGAVYARLLCSLLAESEEVGEIALIFTENGRAVAEFEDSLDWASGERFTVYDNGDMFSAPASGSSGFDAMVVIPCSMGTLGRIAGGVSSDLAGRTADVMLKERRTLILVTRETPLSIIHLRNMTSLSECGAIVCPASPSFYSHPEGIETLCGTVVERVTALLGLSMPRYRWDTRDVR